MVLLEIPFVGPVWTDSASTTYARASDKGDTYTGSLWFNWVENRSIFPVPQLLQGFFNTSGFDDHPVVWIWCVWDNASAITFFSHVIYCSLEWILFWEHQISSYKDNWPFGGSVSLPDSRCETVLWNCLSRSSLPFVIIWFGKFLGLGTLPSALIYLCDLA